MTARVRWEHAPYGTAQHTTVGRYGLTVMREPGTNGWRADLWRGRRQWSSWRPSERAAKRAAIVLARRLERSEGR